MDKSAFSVLVGLGLIVIIIESTALASTLHLGSGSSGAMPTVQVTPVVTQKVTLDASPEVTPGITTTVTRSESGRRVNQAAPSQGPDDMNSTGLNDSENASLRGIRSESVIPQATILPVAKIDYVIRENPIPGDNDVDDHLTYVPVPTKTLVEEDYVKIFDNRMSFLYNSTAISFNLVNPPMKISYNVTPQMMTDEKWIIDRDGGKKKLAEGKIINVTRVDEDSWFQVTVFDKDHGNQIVLQDGFGRNHDQALTKDLTVRNPGNYQLKFEGNFIDVQTSIDVLREGNI